MLHGFTKSSVEFEKTMEFLSENEIYCIAIDLRGCGMSSYANPLKNIQDQVNDISLFASEIL